MWINNLFLPIHTHRWGTMMWWVDHVPSTPQLATLVWIINSPGICSKMASNLANKLCIVACQIMFARYALPILVWNFHEIHARTQISGPRILFSMHASTKIQFSIMHVKHMHDGCDGIYMTFWPQNNIWTILKVSYTLFTNSGQP